MPHSWKPLLDRVLIKPIPPASETFSGLALPAGAAKSLNGPPSGRVVAAGPGQYVNGSFCPVSDALTPGAVVLYAGAAGTEVQHAGSDHLLLRETDILSVVEPSYVGQPIYPLPADQQQLLDSIAAESCE